MGAASPTPAPANVPPAVPTATPEPPAPTVAQQGGGARPPRLGPDHPCPAPRPVPPAAEPSWWDDQARRRQYDRGELRASGDCLGLARPAPARSTLPTRRRAGCGRDC